MTFSGGVLSRESPKIGIRLDAPSSNRKRLISESRKGPLTRQTGRLTPVWSSHKGALSEMRSDQPGKQFLVRKWPRAGDSVVGNTNELLRRTAHIRSVALNICILSRAPPPA